MTGERRRHPRIPMTVDVEAEYEDGKTVTLTRNDISGGGAILQWEDPGMAGVGELMKLSSDDELMLRVFGMLDDGAEAPRVKAQVVRIKDRKSNRLRGNILSPRGPVKSRRKPLLSSGGSVCARNRPAQGVAETEFSLGDGCVCGKRATVGPAALRRAALPGHPLIVLTRAPARAGRRDRRRSLPRQRWHAL